MSDIEDITAQEEDRFLETVMGIDSIMFSFMMSYKDSRHSAMLMMGGIMPGDPEDVGPDERIPFQNLIEESKEKKDEENGVQ